MKVETLLVIFIGVTSLALVIQSLSLWRASRAIGQMLRRLGDQSEAIEKETREVISKFRQAVELLKPLGQVAETASKNVDFISQMLQKRGQEVDRFVEELTQMGREQASKIDYLVTDTVQKIQQTTEVIQKDILRPAVEISSFFKGIKTGLEYLFSRKQGRREEGYPEEELFI